MKMVAAMLVSVLATFGLTIVAELFVMNLRLNGTHLPFAELAVVFPLIALMAGSLVGLIAKEKAKVAAGLGMAPWLIFSVHGAGRGHTATSWWVIMLAVALIYLVLGMAAAILVGRRMVHTAALTSR